LPLIPPFIEPDWPAPENVQALCTTRQGGHSLAPYASLNLGDHVGDSAHTVGANKDVLAGLLRGNTEFSWLTQVHGIDVVEAAPNGSQGGAYPRADAQWSRRSGLACAVLTADCLPILLCSAAGNAVAAVHAGWRGLLAGVVENSVRALDASPEQLLVWLGPAIGPSAFEVGPEVRRAFVAAAGTTEVSATEACFVENPVASEHSFGQSSGRTSGHSSGHSPGHSPSHYMANLYSLARLRLQALGVSRIYGGDFCTYSDPERFFSYRRDGQTGRMASLILLR
jgi:YfiH family protein